MQAPGARAPGRAHRMARLCCRLGMAQLGRWGLAGPLFPLSSLAFWLSLVSQLVSFHRKAGQCTEEP